MGETHSFPWQETEFKLSATPGAGAPGEGPRWLPSSPKDT